MLRVFSRCLTYAASTALLAGCFLFGTDSESVERVDLTPDHLEIATGDSARLTAQVTGSEGSAMADPVTYRSTQVAIAEVSDAGWVRGLAAGAALVIGTATGKSDTAFVTVVAVPEPRMLAGAAYDAARQKVLMFGGMNADGWLQDTWLWDGVRWTPSPGGGPSARSYPLIAYDSRRQRMVLHGGSDGGHEDLSDTWEFDGSQWSLVSSDGPALKQGSIAYDENRERIVVLGGEGLFGPKKPRELGETWEWDGATWTMRSATVPSIDRELPALAYLGDRHSVVALVNHYDHGFADMWQWDGTEWTVIADVVLDDSFLNMVARSPSELLAFQNAFRSYRWSGSSWETFPTTNTPEHRFGAILAFDAARSTVVLFGGSGNDNYLNDTYTLTGSVWTRR